MAERDYKEAYRIDPNLAPKISPFLNKSYAELKRWLAGS
jgi:hypothetical protein